MHPVRGKYLDKYAGQQLLTGPQAEAFADHQLAVDLASMPYGGVYAKVSTALFAAQKAATADPTNKTLATRAATLAAEKTTTFEGTTLRGLLLEAYGFWKFGQIALYGAIASFVLAGIMAILVGLGFWHARRVPETEQLVAPATAHS